MRVPSAWARPASDAPPRCGTGAPIGRINAGLKSANNMLVDSGLVYLSNDLVVLALDLDGREKRRANVAFNGSHSLCGLGVPGGNVVQPDFSTC